MLFILFKSLQKVSKTLVNRLTMPNKMVTNTFRSVCFCYVCSKQLKSPFCLASSKNDRPSLLFMHNDPSLFDMIALNLNIDGYKNSESTNEFNQYLFAVCFRIYIPLWHINKYQGIILNVSKLNFANKGDTRCELI